MRITSRCTTLFIVAGGLLLAIGVPSSQAASDSAAPADVFKARELSSVGAWLQIANETEVHNAANRVRGLKTKLASEAAARADATRAIDSANKSLAELEQQLKSIDEKSKAAKDPAEANSFVAPHNEIIRQAKLKLGQIEQLQKKEGKIEDSQSPYADAVATSVQKAEVASERYAVLAADPALSAAIAKYNTTSTPPVKLGPSDVFITDASFLRKCAAELVNDVIPVQIEHGVPIVEVTINGKTQTMVWDSGATIVSFSTETAAAFGLHATDQDRTIESTIGNGQKIKSKLIVVPEIRVGSYIAKDVVCDIAPPGNVRPPDLLGGAFQCHFLCRLDQGAGTLHLTPIDKSASVVASAVSTTVAPGPKLSISQLSPAAHAVPAAVSAPVVVGNPEDVFKSQGVSKLGFLLELPQEAEVHTTVGVIRQRKATITSESLARSNATRAMDSATRDYDQLQSQLTALDARLKSLKNDPTRYNQLVPPYNNTLAQAKAKFSRIDALRQEAGKLADSRPAYTDVVVAACRRLNGASDRYAALAANPMTTAAIEKYNKTATQPLKLGPSAVFLADGIFIRKCATDLAADGIPARMLGGTPRVQVTINGTTQEMLWDSGAGAISLSTETAASFGLHATDQDPISNAILANGQSYQCRQIVAPEIRVGPFIAKNVLCMIWPPSALHPDSLLGGAFQKHFLCRLDQQAGVLHLTPIDKLAESAVDSRPAADEPPR